MLFSVSLFFSDDVAVVSNEKAAGQQWHAHIGDSLQLLTDQRLDVIGVRINTLYRWICCIVCGYSLTDWRAHLRRNHKRHVSDADALYVNDTLATVPAAVADPPLNAPIQGLRTMRGQACAAPNCSFLTTSTLAKTKHKHREYAAITLQQRIRRSPYLQVC